MIIGAIELSLANAACAAAHFRCVLADSKLDADNSALHHAYLALSIARLGRTREALRISDAAFDQGSVPDDVLTRIWRARAQTLHEVGDQKGAEHAVAQAVNIAEAAGLFGQVKKALRVAAKIKPPLQA